MLNLINFILDAFSQHSYLTPISFLVTNSNNVKLRNGYLMFKLVFSIVMFLIIRIQFYNLLFAKTNPIFILKNLYYIVSNY